MSSVIERVESAVADLKQGKMIILTDGPERENEGDLVSLAEHLTSQTMNFMIRNGTGIVCLSMTSALLQQLDLPLMIEAQKNTSYRGTPFTISIDAKDNITTGVSADDRVKTVLAAIADDAKPNHLVRPGHIFPLQAENDGTLKREGHTEGAIDLARIANCKPAAVLCEIMNPDGTMAHGKTLEDFAKHHGLKMVSIDDIITYRLCKEDFISEEITTRVPLEEYGDFLVTAIREKIMGGEHLVFSKENINNNKPTLVRIHSSCKTGDIFHSKRCDCHQQLHYALNQINQEGGALLYLDQEGRGIGLLNKIKAYALQDKGLDTVDANLELGLPVDSRQYHIAANILRRLNIQHVRLLTNNLNKIVELKKYGITQVEREAMPIFKNEHNQLYLKTKKEKMNQAICFDFLPHIKETLS